MSSEKANKNRMRRVRRTRAAKEDQRDLTEVENITRGLYGERDAKKDSEDPDDFYYNMEAIWYDADGPIVKLVAAVGALYLTLIFASTATTVNLHGILASMFFLATSFLIFSGSFDMWKRRPGGTVAGLIFPLVIIALALYKSVN